MTKNYFLKPVYDSAQSFYNKAEIIEEGDTKTLKSYKTVVACIVGDRVEIYPDAHKKALGVTTLRHIKEFLKQNGYKAESKTQIIKDYIKEA